MPNWIDDCGRNWFNKIECKRCLVTFKIENDEVPIHTCLGENGWTSKSNYESYNIPMQLKYFTGISINWI